MARYNKKYNIEGGEHLTLKDGEVEGIKAFNKALSDLELLSSYERLAFLNRGQRNYKGWLSVLQSWVNKLSADINAKDLEEIDNQLDGCKKMLGGVLRNFDINELEETLDSVERKLFKYQKQLGIDNPAKREDSFLKSDEDW